MQFAKIKFKRVLIPTSFNTIIGDFRMLFLLIFNGVEEVFRSAVNEGMLQMGNK